MIIDIALLVKESRQPGVCYSQIRSNLAATEMGTMVW